MEPGIFTLISVGLIRYSCGHISGHHEPIHVKFGVWGFFIMFCWNMVIKMLKCKKKKKNDDVILRYSIQDEYHYYKNSFKKHVFPSGEKDTEVHTSLSPKLASIPRFSIFFLARGIWICHEFAHLPSWSSGELYPWLKIRMFCPLSQNYQHLFEK